MVRNRKGAKTYDFNKFMNVDVPDAGKKGPENVLVEKVAANKPKKRRFGIGSVLLIIFLVYTMIILGTQQMRLYRFERDIASVNNSIEEVHLQQEQLMSQIEMMNSDEYVEKIAREKLGLIKPGEIPYIAVPSEDGADVRIIDRNEDLVDVED